MPQFTHLGNGTVGCCGCASRGVGDPAARGGAHCLGDVLLAQLGTLPGGSGWGGAHTPSSGAGARFSHPFKHLSHSSTARWWGGCNAPTKGDKATRSPLAMAGGQQLLRPPISAEKRDPGRSLWPCRHGCGHGRDVPAPHHSLGPWVTPTRQGAGGLEPHATPTCFSPSAPQWGFPASSCHPGWDFHSAGAHPKTWHGD